MSPDDLSPATVRAMLDGATDGLWHVGHSASCACPAPPCPNIYADGCEDITVPCGAGLAPCDASLMAAAPDLARELLAAWEERDRHARVHGESVIELGLLRSVAEAAKAQLRTVPQVASPERTALIAALKAWDARG